MLVMASDLLVFCGLRMMQQTNLQSMVHLSCYTAIFGARLQQMKLHLSAQIGRQGAAAGKGAAGAAAEGTCGERGSHHLCRGAAIPEHRWGP